MPKVEQSQERKKGVTTVELSASGSWINYISDLVEQEDPELFNVVLGVESNVYVEEQDAMIAEVRPSTLHLIINDYNDYCIEAGFDVEAIALSW